MVIKPPPARKDSDGQRSTFRLGQKKKEKKKKGLICRDEPYEVTGGKMSR